jgi:hypothetical protein
MNCCDYECNQGKDCPARVARARPVMLAAQPLPPTVWRRQVKALAYWALMAVLGLFWLAFLLVMQAWL